MEEYYFLFGLGVLWTIFAVIQDFKTKEVANWLNFSLIGFALAYRAFYSLHIGESGFFLSGLLGFAVFFALAHGFYYLRAFAGGDAKLLMGFGVLLPYSDISGLLDLGLVFVFSLFLFGAVYSFIYSFFIVGKKFSKFKKSFLAMLGRGKYYLGALAILCVVSFFISSYLFLLLLGILILAFLSLYLMALESCMIVIKKPGELSEGDWLEKDVHIGRRLIKKSVHGLSLEEIAYFRKHKKNVLIKEGIPFTPAFLFSLIFIMVFFLGALEVSLLSFF